MKNVVDERNLDNLIDLIYKRIYEKILKELNSLNIEFCAEGIVQTVLGDNAEVSLSFGTTDSIQNLTGETLSVGDKVKVFYNNTNMSGAYIGVKFKGE